MSKKRPSRSFDYQAGSRPGSRGYKLQFLDLPEAEMRTQPKSKRREISSGDVRSSSKMRQTENRHPNQALPDVLFMMASHRSRNEIVSCERFGKVRSVSAS